MKHFEADLMEKGIAYELISHTAQIRTAQEGADFFKIDIGQTSPILILYTGIGYHAAVISGKREKIDFKKIKGIIGNKNVRLATKEEVEQVTGFSPGAVPLLGISLPYIIDRLLFDYPYVFGGTGELSCTLKIDPKALLKLVDVVGFLEAE